MTAVDTPHDTARAVRSAILQCSCCISVLSRQSCAQSPLLQLQALRSSSALRRLRGLPHPATPTLRELVTAPIQPEQEESNQSKRPSKEKVRKWQRPSSLHAMHLFPPAHGDKLAHQYRGSSSTGVMYLGCCMAQSLLLNCSNITWTWHTSLTPDIEIRTERNYLVLWLPPRYCAAAKASGMTGRRTALQSHPSPLPRFCRRIPSIRCSKKRGRCRER